MKNEYDGMTSRGEIAIYQTKDKKVRLEVKLGMETIWLTQADIASLFRTDRSVITKHLRNIFNSKELSKERNVQKMHIPFSDKPVNLYNLDVIISVGYRVNSLRATQFRIWATGVLRKHIVDGYTLNEVRLRQYAHKLQALQKAIKLIGSMKNRKQLEYKEAMGLLEVISDYNYALGLLDDYDYKRLKVSGTSKAEKYVLTYNAAMKVIKELAKKYGGSDLFGAMRDQSFKSSVAAIYQTFGGKDLYPSIEEKAANLLYFIVKNHSFVDGNKRIAASIFLWFLEKNSVLYKEDGSKRLADNALVALTLMIAESNPSERDIIVALVVNLINKNN
jgi:prophage maintenance system killer protein